MPLEPTEKLSAEIKQLIDGQLASFRQPGPLSCNTLHDLRAGTERIRNLGARLDRIKSAAVSAAHLRG